MQIIALRAPVFGTNTLVLAHGSSAVIVDPGAGVAPAVHQVLDDHELTAAAILLTHGHPDHTWDCAAVAPDVPVYIGAGDVDRLTDPVAHLGPLADAFAAMAGTPWRPVAQPRAVGAEEIEPAPGLTVRPVAAPGHTPGSTLWAFSGEVELSGPAFEEAGSSGRYAGDLVLTGDVLFAGSIGRTDLPGGDDASMRQTLRTLIDTLPKGAVLVPGHGPATTTAAELATNPFLRALA
ncbi:MAG TPA: MBL fold metallo-hydrolase [Actinomycetaceae bacterium]|nr:MBL fold metallo-hydrolase [Actinomycetaceae bacterium]